MKKGVWVAKGIMFALVVVVIAFGFIMATMYLWNWLVPELFSGPVINFWQTAGLLALSKILFGGFCKGHCRNRNSHGPWKFYWKEKWGNMSQEERERLKQKMRDKWCYTQEAHTRKEEPTSNG